MKKIPHSLFLTRFAIFLVGFLSSLAFQIQPLKAAMTVVEPLSFGSIALKDNSQVWQLHQLSSGNVIVENGIIILEAGQAGEYFFYNLPPSTTIAITVLDGTGDTDFSGGTTATQFSIQPYLDFPTYNTNQHGELTLKMPGILKTSGNGLTYHDGVYYRFFQLDINY